MDGKYVEQVALILRILPEIARFPDFALHGGTAINLFHHDMPRLSVDVDLTYVPYGKRVDDLAHIKKQLVELSEKLKSIIPGIYIQAPAMHFEEYKLFCSLKSALVKVEVNTINRGLIGDAKQYVLCKVAQETFNSFVEIGLVPDSQLFGGKIVAALDRQHPRDIFDTKILLDRDGLTDEIMMGFLFALFSSKRPLHEILNPSMIDQKNALYNQFKGMSKEQFSYPMFELERLRLIKAIHANLTFAQKHLILSVAKGNPDWFYDNWGSFPGIAWKIKNLKVLETKDPAKYKSQISEL